MNKTDHQAILLVEDDEIDVKVMKRIFQKQQLENPLYVAKNGQEALRLLREGLSADAHIDQKPGLIFLDLNMPIMTGLEFLKVVKEDEALQHIPVVIMTTSDSRNEIIEGFRLGAAGYFTKSFDLDKFSAVVSTICEYWHKSQVPDCA